MSSSSFLRASVMVFAAVWLAASSGGCTDDRMTTPPCASSFERSCDGVCVPIATDANNCGGCGIRCAAGQLCRVGSCVNGMMPMDGSVPGIDLGPPGACSPSCPSTQRCCGTTCVNRNVPSGTDGRSDRSFMNCGACGNACDPMTASACSGTSCTCGTLGRPCAAGQICRNAGSGFTCQANCGLLGGPCPAGTTCCGAGDEAVCINTNLDAFNCGACGNACAGGTACSAGMCVATCGGAVCAAGQLCCADTCVNADASNCGGCGVTCSGDDICGRSLFGGGTCCGPEAFPGTVGMCTPPTDAGVSPMDAGLPEMDAGTPEADAGDAELDASVADPDATVVPPAI
jgi:hypothetical protein